MIDKEKVKDNFSQAVNSYEEHAVVQKYMAKKLLEMIEEEEKAAEILEIGAGTGLCTERSIISFPQSNHLLVDISPAMINKCRKKFAEQSKIDFLTADAENLALDKKFDLILSNAAVQWFKNLAQTMERLLDHLTREGKMYFSTFGPKNFKELRDCFKDIFKSSFSQRFLSKREIEDVIAQYCTKVNIKEEEYREKFATAYDFLQATKKIGANSAKKDKPKLTPNRLRRLEELYEDRYSEAGEIIVTHHLLFVEVQK